MRDLVTFGFVIALGLCAIAFVKASLCTVCRALASWADRVSDRDAHATETN